MIDDIYGMRPVNRVSALVTSQKGCSDVESLEQKRSCLAARLTQLGREISSLPKNHKIRKELGQEKYLLQNQIRDINREVKCKAAINIDLDPYIIKAAKDEVSNPVWRRIMAQAKQNKITSDAFYQNKLDNKGE